jgi:hypothetical protein
MRTDEAELIWGQRLNVWTSIVVFLLGIWIIWYTGRRAARASADEPAPEDDDTAVDADAPPPETGSTPAGDETPKSQDVG